EPRLVIGGSLDERALTIVAEDSGQRAGRWSFVVRLPHRVQLLHVAHGHRVAPVADLDRTVDDFEQSIACANRRAVDERPELRHGEEYADADMGMTSSAFGPAARSTNGRAERSALAFARQVTLVQRAPSPRAAAPPEHRSSRPPARRTAQTEARG